MILARALAAAFLAACILAGGAASAQNYPNRPVTMIVAFPPGGAKHAPSGLKCTGTPTHNPVKLWTSFNQ